MAPPSQKSDQRPISFVFHNTATGESPVEVRLVIRPEDLTRTEPSRLATTQTFGGAWADNFGRGIPTVQISGHTGWGQGSRPNGISEFERLHETVFQRWHRDRATAIADGHDPDKVRLIFADLLDGFTWVVAPQSFVLRRSKTRPLLYQYQISMTWLSDDVRDTMFELASMKADAWEAEQEEMAGLESLEESSKMIDEFLGEFDSFGTMLGGLQDSVGGLVVLTANVLSSVQGTLRAAMGVVTSITDPLLNIGANLSRAAANVMHAVQSIISFPMSVAAKFARVASAFTNAFCVLRNIFRKRKFLPNYDSLFGAGNCSSTAGGNPISKYNTENPFAELFPVDISRAGISTNAASSLSRLAGMDVVLARPSVDALRADVSAVVSGLQVA